MAGRVAPRVRLAGHGLDRLGRAVTWSIADGERGRRWREATTVAATAGGAAEVTPAALAHAVTIETGHAGQWLRLEVAAPTGLLSLHPERDASIHGNVVSGSGVRPVDLGVIEPPLVDVRDSLVGETALCRALERLVAAGEGSTVSVVRVSATLDVTIAVLQVFRRDARSWELTDTDGIRSVSMGDRGAPVTADAGAKWPLETGS